MAINDCTEEENNHEGEVNNHEQEEEEDNHEEEEADNHEEEHNSHEEEEDDSHEEQVNHREENYNILRRIRLFFADPTTAWILAFGSLIITIVTLFPGFKGQEMKQTSLAEWSALKDYYEHCRGILQAGQGSPECEAAVAMSLPPPPYVKIGASHRLLRRVARTLNIVKKTGVHDLHRILDFPNANVFLVALTVLLLAFIFAYLQRVRPEFASPTEREVRAERSEIYDSSIVGSRTSGNNTARLNSRAPQLLARRSRLAGIIRKVGQYLHPIGVGSSDMGNQDRSQRQRADVAGEQSNAGLVLSNNDTRYWILFGVPDSRLRTNIHHVPINDQSNDSSFCRSLKQHDRASRGRIRSWLSIWRLNHCEIVKFRKLAPGYIIEDRTDSLDDFPNDPDYLYHPPPQLAENPVPPPGVSSMHLNTCDSPCRWSFLHECIPQLESSSVIARIPKKRNRFDTESLNNGDVFAWELEAKYVLSVTYVVMYHLIISLPLFGIWRWWTIKYPNDPQSATVPVTLVIGLLSLFWSTSGVLRYT